MSNQCTATAKSTGDRCQLPAIKGGTVCHKHGGAAPQVRKKAQERLDEMADSVTADIQRDIKDLQEDYEDATSPDEKLAILSELRQHWKIILDRTDHGPTETREFSGSDDGSPIMIIEQHDNNDNE